MGSSTMEADALTPCHSERSEESLQPTTSALTRGLTVKTYYVYIMTSPSGTLYIGVTNDLHRRVYEHKKARVPGFTSKYGINRLVYFEESSAVHAAIAREKQLKRWRRDRKTALIQSVNPKWQDLSDGWY